MLTAILVLSLVLPSLRPVTGAPDTVEHLAIFALCGFCFSLGYRISGILKGVALVVFAGGIEMLQLMVPGRHARVVDFAVDALASCAGVLIGRIAAKIVADTQRES